jgi:hypothetical protein
MQSPPDRFQNPDYQFVLSQVDGRFHADLSVDELVAMLRRDRLRFIEEFGPGFSAWVSRYPAGFVPNDAVPSYLDHLRKELAKK